MELFTPLEVAKKMNVDRFTPYSWIKNGQLRATDVSQTGIKKARWVIREEDFEKFKVEHENRVVKCKVNQVDLVQEFAEIKNRLLELAIMMEDLEEKINGKHQG